MESLIALGGLVGFALFCVLVSAAVKGARARLRHKPKPKRLLIHAINDDRCTGCDACVTVCPTDVLELVTNKSRVLRFDDCIQCEQCALVCPTTALVMHYQGTQPPALRVPYLDDYFQAAPGLYLIGEAGGKPLVKNASNLGRAVIEHMLHKGGLRHRAAVDTSGKIGEVDVLIVGSGPGGLSAALSCIERGLTYVVLEKDELVASTIARWPKGKECMAEPYDVRCVGLLPVWDAKKDELLAAWRSLIDRRGVSVQTRETVEEVKRLDGSRFEVRTTRKLYRAQRVVLAIGTRGKPRRLGVPGENLAKVTALLGDAADHRGQRVIVVGGGDSAVEAAIALAETAARVTLSYRGKQLSRCKNANRVRLAELEQKGRVVVRFSTNLVEIKQETVKLRRADGRVEELDNDHVFVCIGGDAPVKWLEQVGVRFVERPHMYQMAATDRLVEQLIGAVEETRAPSGPVVVRADLTEEPTVLRFPVERVRKTA
jgi:putative YpdA family bacillithiol system oxidoreductase